MRSDGSSAVGLSACRLRSALSRSRPRRHIHPARAAWQDHTARHAATGAATPAGVTSAPVHRCEGQARPRADGRRLTAAPSASRPALRRTSAILVSQHKFDAACLRTSGVGLLRVKLSGRRRHRRRIISAEGNVPGEERSDARRRKGCVGADRDPPIHGWLGRCEVLGNPAKLHPSSFWRHHVPTPKAPVLLQVQDRSH